MFNISDANAEFDDILALHLGNGANAAITEGPLKPPSLGEGTQMAKSWALTQFS
jgi:hypothetical protein